jgi:hypothetical protein
MVALDLDLPLPLPVSEMKLRPRYAELIEALRNFEFRSLTAEVEREAARVSNTTVAGKALRGNEERSSSNEQDRTSDEPASAADISTQGELF